MHKFYPNLERIDPRPLEELLRMSTTLPACFTICLNINAATRQSRVAVPAYPRRATRGDQ